MPSIDLNCDLGESFGAYTIGMDAEILPYITSANIACGFHAGDPSVMQKSVLLCKKYGVQVGAHPGLPDLQGFGRRKMAISSAEAEAGVMYQIGALKAFCEAAGVPLHHVKPHGALYNMAAKDPALAAAICRAVQAAAPGAVLLALSGGVDSSVVAALLAEAVGPQLTCVFVDHGLMRLNEGDEVEEAFSKWNLNLIRMNEEDEFLAALKGLTAPEDKRKAIGAQFIRTFEKMGKEIGAKVGKVDYLAQGTIYPDVIESGKDDAAVIKSHHNVGGLPDFVDFKEIIEPLRMLFKDEVRQLGFELGLPKYLVMRQPFPGPGLGIRITGEITKEKCDILREADAIFREEIANAGLDTQINQYFAVLTNTRTVGVMGDSRTYDYALALRGVTTSDFMTADWARIPYDVLDKASSRIVNEVAGVNRIVYDITSKPPATIEWE